MTTGLERIAAKARQESKRRFPSLAHHLDAERLWHNLCHVPRQTAPGSDGQTGEMDRISSLSKLVSLAPRLLTLQSERYPTSWRELC
jgi:hypothetical protein